MKGTFLGGSHKKDFSIWGLNIVAPHLEKLALLSSPGIPRPLVITPGLPLIRPLPIGYQYYLLEGTFVSRERGRDYWEGIM